MQKTKMSKILELRSKNFREVGQGVDSVSLMTVLKSY